ncbi:MAG: GNAT family N-acetyltransferase [Anaerolineales bacterium]|nr:GNAT family N-acetyltransferase [Anaerolineales bacterium]
MNNELLTGDLVKLVAVNPAVDADRFSRWALDSEYSRLLDTDPARLWSAQKVKQWLEKSLEKESGNEFTFMMNTLENEQTIGFIGLDGIRWNHGDAYVGIGIGEREFRGKGYGTDAMRVLLKYAFTELNLHRVSLNVFAYNSMAIRSYEKAGYVIEGKQREYLNREGKRWDMVFMGILKEDWIKTGAT